MADVGIVMPVYKQDPEYLRRALNSVLNQTYPDYRFVIVVDGAPSETIEIIKEVTKNDSRVKIIIKKINRGVASALNFGFDYLNKKRDVKYLTWVSSDNIYYPTFIEKLRQTLVESPQEIGLVYSSFLHIDEKGEYVNDFEIKNFQKYQEQPKENLLDACFIGVSFMYRKEYASIVGGYEMEPVEDYDYWLRITEYCDIKYVPEVLMEYRKNSPHSVSAQLQTKLEHRRYRYVLQLTKFRARIRRKIPFEVTILFPVTKAFEEVINKLESILEQSFSNFKLCIIDTSENSNGRELFELLSDPRIQYDKYPGFTTDQSIQTALQEVNTPYTLICDVCSCLTNMFVLYRMVALLRQTESVSRNIISIQDQHGSAVVRDTSVSNEPSFGELYQTSKMKHFFN